MVHFASETLGRVHYASSASRINLISRLLTVATVVIPALILYSIGSAWSDYREVFVQPSMTIQDYQLFCQKSDNTVNTYNGSGLIFSAGSFNNIIDMSLMIQETTSIVSCSLSIFGSVTLSSSVQSNFYTGLFFDFYTLQGNIKQVDIISKLKIAQSQPMQESYKSLSVPYSTVSLQDSFNEMAKRNISTMVVDKSTTVTTSDAATPVQISVSVVVPTQQIVVSSNIKTQLLEFIRQYVYIFVPLWFVKNRLVSWVLQNRIYLTKASPNYKIN